MHTEEQAAKLWCPMVRAARGHDNGAIAPWSRCIASACSMWRWADPASRYSNGERKGYCGLAGKGAA